MNEAKAAEELLVLRQRIEELELARYMGYSQAIYASVIC